ncbi:MAG: T9SS C-terminal target domain-containing protein [Ignavibacteriae bacterium]|nr:MAG: T9SS C-terminal target domain-containing protein [Ignavibacteriota bacterium]
MRHVLRLIADRRILAGIALLIGIFETGNAQYFTNARIENSSTSMLVDTGTVWRGPAFAAGQSKFIGCAYSNQSTAFLNYWNQITPENGGKFGSVASSSDSSQWNWSGLDAAYTLAVNYGVPFKDHCLVWGSQQPAWITGSGLDSAQQANAIEKWIRMVGRRYPMTDMVDVVNEPLPGHNPAPYAPALGGAGATGWDWVIWAFQKARLYLPDTKLILNEYGIINSNSATTSYLQIINLLKNRNLIDGIGVQGHRFELESADTSVLRSNLDRLAATGLPIYISEFDLGNLGNTGTPDDNQQLQLYQKIFPVLWKHPGVKGITFWGYVQGSIWQSSCYLVRSNGIARPALFWLAQYIKDNPMGVEETIAGVPFHDQLEQNFPNPFNPSTTIRYTITTTSNVTLKVFDMLGREVQTLVNSIQAPGRFTVLFNGHNLASGVYVYQLNAGPFTETKKLLLVK